MRHVGLHEMRSALQKKRKERQKGQQKLLFVHHKLLRVHLDL
jgi:hypothetical protein